jgi:hypothetical protein
MKIFDQIQKMPIFLPPKLQRRSHVEGLGEIIETLIVHKSIDYSAKTFITITLRIRTLSISKTSKETLRITTPSAVTLSIRVKYVLLSVTVT